ncbi:MAG: TIGR04283 family arsenosugar biosynthesis glycosyltransferase [Rhodothermales bacterium]
MLISVVVPTLNEADVLESTLRCLRKQPGPLEIIVADGGSSDGTLDLVGRDCSVVHAEPGRASQMNAGAQTAGGEVLLFLHSDTLLPECALETVRRVVQNGTDAGIFRLAFDDKSVLLSLSAAATRLPLFSICFGDRALFVRRSTFMALGGFSHTPIFEDIELAKRLGRQATFRFISESVTTSARRYRAVGHWRQQWHNASLWLRYMLGANPEHLAREYSYRRESSR